MSYFGPEPVDNFSLMTSITATLLSLLMICATSFTLPASCPRFPPLSPCHHDRLKSKHFAKLSVMPGPWEAGVAPRTVCLAVMVPVLLSRRRTSGRGGGGSDEEEGGGVVIPLMALSPLLMSSFRPRWQTSPQNNLLLLLL